MSQVPIGAHALLSDCRGSALVSAYGSVDWWCHPRFDSASTFARLLDERAGHFGIAPASPGFTPRWAYLHPGLVLQTTWSSEDGEFVVTDALALGIRERGHQLGRSSPGVLLREVVCTRGEVAVHIDYAPRPEFGLVHPRLAASDGRIETHGGSTLVVLSTEAPLSISHGLASGTVTLTRNQRVSFAVEHDDPWQRRAQRWQPRAIRRQLEGTVRAWRSWSALHQHYDGPLREQVLHSGVVLQGLTYSPSGAIVAAATTSLPEGVGSGRNWDYRYTWVRDASMTLQGLFIAACPHEAGRFFDFLARAAGTQLDRNTDLQIMFGVAGERDLTEHDLEHLSGWRDSGPVRIGNGAWAQRQLDVYGAIMDAAHTLQVHTMPLADTTRSFLVAAVDAAAARWSNDDQGIWEVRGPARPYLHSKLMCWVALDRGVAMATELGAQAHLPGWRTERDAVRHAILHRGWSDRVGAFTQYFGSDDLDASVLTMATVGFLPPDDARLLATVDTVEAKLSDARGLIYRYRGFDGLSSDEGTFLLCTFWLAHALAYTDQPKRARVVLDRAASYATDLGLLAEQVDPVTGELLGNYPQAFSHLGLITAAHALGQALNRATTQSR